MIKIIATLILLLASIATNASEVFSQNSIVLLQPDFVLKKRVSVDVLSSYIKALNDVTAQFASTKPEGIPTSGFVVFAVRPNGNSKIWLDLSPSLPKEQEAELIKLLERVPISGIKEGTVVVGINVSLWGKASSGFAMPKPQEWLDAMSKRKGPVEITHLVDEIWPNQPGS